LAVKKKVIYQPLLARHADLFGSITAGFESVTVLVLLRCAFGVSQGECGLVKD